MLLFNHKKSLKKEVLKIIFIWKLGIKASSHCASQTQQQFHIISSLIHCWNNVGDVHETCPTSSSAAQKLLICIKVCHQQLLLSPPWMVEGGTLNLPAASGRAGQDVSTQEIVCPRWSLLPLYTLAETQLLLAALQQFSVVWTGNAACFTDPTCSARKEQGQHHPQSALYYYLGYFVHWCNPSASQYCDQTLLWATIKYFTIKRKQIRLYFCNFQSLCKSLIKSNCFNPTDAELKLSPTNT